MAFFELPRLNWRRVVTIVRKELLVLLCNRVSRVLIIVPPLMQIVIFQLADVADFDAAGQRRVIFIDFVDQRDRFRPAPAADNQDFSIVRPAFR